MRGDPRGRSAEESVKAGDRVQGRIIGRLVSGAVISIKISGSPCLAIAWDGANAAIYGSALRLEGTLCPVDVGLGLGATFDGGRQFEVVE